MILAVAILILAQVSNVICCAKEVKVPVNSRKPNVAPTSTSQPEVPKDCRICCEDEANDPDFLRISDSFKQNLTGQHIASSALSQSFKAHLFNKNPQKTLLLSLHGSAGTGKSFAAKLVAEALFNSGLSSSSVLYLIGSSISGGDSGKAYVKEKVESVVRKCPRALVIIDDVDPLEDGLLDVLQPFVEYHENVAGVDYRKAVIILISNRGGKEINKIVVEQSENGFNRDALEIKQFERAITNSVFNSKGALYRSKLIEKGLIDLYIPFLPLEIEHVQECVRSHLRKMKKEIDEKLVLKVADSFQYFADIFSSAGCKKVPSRTDMLLANEEL